MDAFKKLVDEGKNIVADAKKGDINALKEDAQQVQEQVNQVNKALNTDTASGQTANAPDAVDQAASDAHAQADEKLGGLLDNVANMGKDAGQSV